MVDKAIIRTSGDGGRFQCVLADVQSPGLTNMSRSKANSLDNGQVVDESSRRTVTIHPNRAKEEKDDGDGVLETHELKMNPIVGFDHYASEDELTCYNVYKRGLQKIAGAKK